MSVHYILFEPFLFEHFLYFHTHTHTPKIRTFLSDPKLLMAVFWQGNFIYNTLFRRQTKKIKGTVKNKKSKRNVSKIQQKADAESRATSSALGTAETAFTRGTPSVLYARKYLARSNWRPRNTPASLAGLSVWTRAFTRGVARGFVRAPYGLA